MNKFTELGFSSDSRLQSILSNFNIHGAVPKIYDLYCVLLHSRTPGSHKKFRSPNIAKSKQGILHRVAQRMSGNNMLLWNNTMQDRFSKTSKSHLPAQLRNNKFFVKAFLETAKKNAYANVQYRKNGTLHFSFRAKSPKFAPAKFLDHNYVSAEQTQLNARKCGKPFSPHIKPATAGFIAKHFFIAMFDKPLGFPLFHDNSFPGGTIGVYQRVPESTRRGDIFESSRIALDDKDIRKIFHAMHSTFSKETQNLIQLAISVFFYP